MTKSTQKTPANSTTPSTINALYASPSVNFCAHTLSRKTAPIHSLKALDKETLADVLQYVKDTSITHLITPTENTSIEALSKKAVSFTTDPQSDWSHVHTYTKNSLNNTTLFILDRAFETLSDPRPLIRWLRTALKANPQSKALVISPEADMNPTDRLPSNPGHYREWTKERLHQFLSSAGFTIETCHTTGSAYNIATLTASEEMHHRLLSSSGLPSPRNSLIITTEHADTKATGGIGSYIKEVEQTLSPEERPLVLVSLPEPFEKLMVTKEKAANIIDIRSIIHDPSPTIHTTDWKSTSVDVYKATEELLYIYDQLHIVEFQEYQGIGARLVQAKQAEQLPKDVTCVVRGHGSQVYIDRASYSWSGMEKADVFELERISIELADEVSLPTQYLKDLYTSTGYILNNSTHIQRLPYAYPSVPPITYRSVSKLIFLGKRSVMKGYPDFYDTVDTLTDPKDPLYNSSICEINVIAAPGDAIEFDTKITELAKKRSLKITIGPLPRHEVLDALLVSAPHSIVCLPYGGDNHPVTVLEMIANHIRFIAYGNGGIPELIPSAYHNHFICESNSQAMAMGINALIKLPLKKTSQLINSLYTQAVKDQEKINSSVRQSYLRQPAATQHASGTSSYMSLATVLVPIYATDLDYVAQTIESLNNQLLPPAEVLFINDKSPSNKYVEKLHTLIASSTKIPYRIIDHEVNLGLAGARNTALAHCKTKYLINLDSDDIVSAQFVYDYVHFMENNPSYSACTCALESFTDKDGWNTKQTNPDYSYAGLGDALILGVSKNIFGHAGSCVVTEDARKIGGWDASDRSKWEDWAFFLKMSSLGMHIFNFPSMHYHYRINATSMARTYAAYPAEMRIARNIAGLSIWESHRLYAFIKDEALHTKGRAHSIEPDTLTYRVAKRISASINKAPAVKNVAKTIIQGSWDISKKITKK